MEFVIIGGWSAILHGSAHITYDLDLLFSRKPENLNRMVAARSIWQADQVQARNRSRKDLRVARELESLLEAEEPE